MFPDDHKELLSKRDEDDKTLLHRACEEGRVELATTLAKMFIKNGLPLNSKDNS